MGFFHKVTKVHLYKYAFRVFHTCLYYIHIHTSTICLNFIFSGEREKGERGMGVGGRRFLHTYIYTYIYAIYIYLHVCYTCIPFFLVACIYAQLFETRRNAKSMIDRSIVPF